MKLKVFKALWGMEGSLESKFERIAAAGYAGVEAPMPDAADEGLFRELLAKHGLAYIAMVFTNGNHKESFREQVERAATFDPVLINAHSAKDDMSHADQADFYRFAADVERSVGVPVAHETHRGRAMFTPWDTERILNETPGISLCADFSHWCCVCETLLENQGPRLATAIGRTLQIHARVGHQEGPQVNHPAAPEHAEALAAHAVWWREIARERRDQGAEFLTIVPEFGPPGYLQTLPFTQTPVADLWEVCLWMKNYLESQWEDWLA